MPHLTNRRILNSPRCFRLSQRLSITFSVAQSCPTLCDPMMVAHQAPLPMEFFRQGYWNRLPFPIPGDLPHPGIKPMSLPSPASSVGPFSSCLQSFPASGSFPMSQFFTSDGQSIEASASTSFPPINIQHCFLLGLTVWISLLSTGLSRVFSNTTVQKHQFFSFQVSLWANSHIHT